MATAPHLLKNAVRRSGTPHAPLASLLDQLEGSVRTAEAPPQSLMPSALRTRLAALAARASALCGREDELVLLGDDGSVVALHSLPFFATPELARLSPVAGSVLRLVSTAVKLRCTRLGLDEPQQLSVLGLYHREVEVLRLDCSDEIPTCSNTEAHQAPPLSRYTFLFELGSEGDDTPPPRQVHSMGSASVQLTEEQAVRCQSLRAEWRSRERQRVLTPPQPRCAASCTR